MAELTTRNNTIIALSEQMCLRAGISEACNCFCVTAQSTALPASGPGS